MPRGRLETLENTMLACTILSGIAFAVQFAVAQSRGRAVSPPMALGVANAGFLLLAMANCSATLRLPHYPTRLKLASCLPPLLVLLNLTFSVLSQDASVVTLQLVPAAIAFYLLMGRAAAAPPRPPVVATGAAAVPRSASTWLAFGRQATASAKLKRTNVVRVGAALNPIQEELKAEVQDNASFDSELDAAV